LASLTETDPDLHRSGETVARFASVGSLTCTGCGYAIAAAAMEDIPECPNCGGSHYRHSASLFEHPTVNVEAVEPATAEPVWMEKLREQTRTDGKNRVVYEEDGAAIAFELRERWMRIGRSAAADIQLDDPSVSRRHALIVRTEAGSVSALDDRSLNGLFINGEKVDWAPLRDGDELEIGRYRLYVILPD
jgi:predicted  nucleic acid-binding Zn-ribbon protein